jgi:hypothetical protein
LSDDYEEDKDYYARRDAERNEMLASILKFYALLAAIILLAVLLLSWAA